VEKKLVDNQKLKLKDPFEIFGGIFCLKKGVLLFFFLLLFGVAQAQNTEVKIDNPKQSFETVDQGEVLRFKYMVTNVGSVPLLLKDYDVECSCTSAEYVTEPILPGKSATILVAFDTKSAYERQDRTVEVLANVKGGFIKLRFKGNVRKKKS
jgi:hypothetical protein